MSFLVVSIGVATGAVTGVLTGGGTGTSKGVVRGVVMGDDLRVVKCLVIDAVTDVVLVLVWAVVAGSNANVMVVVLICFVTVWQYC